MLMDEMRHQAVRFGAEVHVAMVTDIEVDRHPFVVHLDDGASYQTKTVGIATGARTRRPTSLSRLRHASKFPSRTATSGTRGDSKLRCETHSASTKMPSTTPVLISS